MRPIKEPKELNIKKSELQTFIGIIENIAHFVSMIFLFNFKNGVNMTNGEFVNVGMGGWLEHANLLAGYLTQFNLKVMLYC